MILWHDPLIPDTDIASGNKCAAALVSFYSETHEKPYFRYTEGEALGVRQQSCRLSQYNQSFKGGSSVRTFGAAPHFMALFGRSSSTIS